MTLAVYDFTNFGLEFKNLTAGDIPAFHYWRNQEEIRKFLGNPRPIDLTVLKNWHARISSSGETLPFLIYDSDGACGYVEISHLGGRYKHPFLGFFCFIPNFMAQAMPKK